MPPLKFLPRQRLAHARQYQAVYAGKVQRTRAGLGLTGIPNDVGFTRLGLSVGKRLGNAAQRNRAKRLLREAFRLSQHELPPGLDLIATVRGGRDLDLATCRAALVEMAASIAREWERRS